MSPEKHASCKFIITTNVQNSSDNDADDDGDIITISHALSIIMSQPDSQFWVSKYIILFGLI